MSKLDSLSKKAGLPPGTLVHVGSPKPGIPLIKLIEFSEESFREDSSEDWEEFDPESSETVKWYNIDGIHSTELIQKIGGTFNLHQLLQEDVVNTFHRPKFEEFNDYIFVTLKMVGLNPKGKIITEHVSLVLGHDWVLSFQEREGDVFEPLRLRLRNNVATARKRKADYVFYRLIDMIVDNYFHVAENLSLDIENLEEYVVSNPDREAQMLIQELKKKINGFRKSVQPLRDAVNQVLKSDHILIEEQTMVYFRDVSDHLNHLMETLDTQREMLASILDLYLSGISFRMNQIMQVLTIMATIFIPLTFIAGIYGMNFEYMPELQWKYGYFTIMGIMGSVFLGMLYYFRKKKWL